MRIDKLKLTDFKNLVDFEVDFAQSSPRQVIVGRNGVGKSNLLEALTWIFRDLDLGAKPQFAYEIEYLCNRHFVKIECAQTNEGDCKVDPTIPRQFKRQYWITPKADLADEVAENDRGYQPISEPAFRARNRPINQQQPNPDRLLPLYVFGYYSGAIPRFAQIFEKHEEKYYKEQITGEEAPLRPLFRATSHHSQFALLAFFATHDPAQKFLKEEFRIDGLDSVLFSLREPYWNKGKPSPERRATGDPRFWLAGGKVGPFLSSLFNHCFAPMSGQERIRISIGQNKTKERRYCFLPDQASLQAMAKGLTNKEFFARLESLVFSDLVGGSGTDVRIWIRLDDGEAITTFEDLAEGERQLLTVLGLMRFTAENEALFLLDEPDTHLNPAWCLDYMDNLRQYGAEPEESQIIMTTHSPLTFAGMDKDEVVVMERAADGKIFAEHPISSPKGMGFAAILTSDFFGLRSTLDPETLRKIDYKRDLAQKDNKTDGDLRELERLNAELGRLDFSHSVRDPLYLEFIRAITAATDENPALKEPELPPDMWKRRQEIAKDIATRLLENNPKG